MSNFWLIRHGESEGNIGIPGAYRGAPPLTERGRQQVQAVAASWYDAPELIVASNFIRAQESAEPLRARFPSVPYTIWPVQEFTPLADHHYVGVRQQDRNPAFRGYFERGNPDYVDGAGAETFRDGIRRVVNLISLLRKQPNCVVYSHATFLRMVYWLWLHQSEEKACEGIVVFGRFMQSFPLPNCAIIHGHFNTDGTLMLSAPQA